MPRGVYERKPRAQILPNRLRALADKIEKELEKVDEAERIIEQLQSLTAHR